MKRTQKTTFITIIIAVFALVFVVGAFAFVSNYQQNATQATITQTDTIEIATPAKAILDAENYPHVYVSDLFPSTFFFGKQVTEALREEALPPAQAAIQMATIAEKSLNQNFTNLTTLVWLERFKGGGINENRLLWCGVVGYDTTLIDESYISNIILGYNDGTTRARVVIDAITGVVLTVESNSFYQNPPGEMRANGEVMLNGKMVFSFKNIDQVAQYKEKVSKLTQQRIAAMGLAANVKQIKVIDLNYFFARSFCEQEDGSRLIFDWSGSGENADYQPRRVYLQAKEEVDKQRAQNKEQVEQSGPPPYYTLELIESYTPFQKKEIDALWEQRVAAQQALYAATAVNRAALQQNVDKVDLEVKLWSFLNVPREYWPEGAQQLP